MRERCPFLSLLAVLLDAQLAELLRLRILEFPTDLDRVVRLIRDDLVVEGVDR